VVREIVRVVATGGIFLCVLEAITWACQSGTNRQAKALRHRCFYLKRNLKSCLHQLPPLRNYVTVVCFAVD
jgi:hypothetical protein